MVNIHDVISLAGEYADEFVKRKTFEPGKTYIPPTFPDLYRDDMVELVRVALGGWYTEWTYAKKFQNLLCEKLSQSHAILVNSGSSANLAAIQGCVEKFEDPQRRMVITTATGFPTTVSAIYHANKIPYYIDINPETLAPDYSQLYEAVTQYGQDICGAIFAHTLGFPFGEPDVADMLGSRRWFVSDACDALGTTWLDPVSNAYRSVGYHADATTLSFFPAHHIMSGEGGAVLTNSQELHDIVSSVVSWGRGCNCLPGQNNTCGMRFNHPDRGYMPEGWDHKYLFTRLGYNLKMTDLQAALGWSQLSHVDEMNAKRWHNYKYLRDGLDGLFPRIEFVRIPDFAFPIPFGFPILTRDAPELIAHLEQNKVGTRRVFGGNILRQPGYSDLAYARANNLSGSDRVMNEMFWVACGPTLTEEMMDYMIYVFYRFYE